MSDFDVTVFGNVADIDNAIKKLRRKELKANEVKANREAAKAEKAKALAEAKANLGTGRGSWCSYKRT